MRVRASRSASGGEHPMGESKKPGFQLSFNRFLRVDFQGSRVTSDGGLILVRELDERLGVGELIERHLTDCRANNSRLSFADLLRQSVYSRLAGYEDVNDAERLSQDPAFRLIGSEKIWDRGAALTSRLQSFETEVLTQEENLAGLAALNRELVAKAEAIDSPRRIVLDMDSTEVPVYGQQEKGAEPFGKRVSPGVACPPDAKPAPPGAAGNPVDQHRLKTCTERSYGLYKSWNLRVKTEIPV